MTLEMAVKIEEMEEMPIHSEAEIHHFKYPVTILRVPSGWIYTVHTGFTDQTGNLLSNSVFVPEALK